VRLESRATGWHLVVGRGLRLVDELPQGLVDLGDVQAPKLASK